MRYNKGYYPGNFFRGTELEKHNRKIIYKLAKQTSNDTIIVDELWLIKNPTFISSIKSNIRNLIVYSGIDASTISFFHQNLYKDICNFNHINVGNFYGNYYFSYWLDIVYDNLELYQKDFSVNYMAEHVKPFMCLNRKPHLHRQELVYKLVSRGLDKKGIVSLGYDSETPYMIEGLSPIILQEDIIDDKGNNCKIEFNSERFNITNNIFSLGHINNWGGHLVNVVTETEIYSPGFITEKTLKPIIGMRPFMVLGDHFTYRILHDWGIDTFDDILGDGYKHHDYKERIKWIVNTLEDISLEKNCAGLLLSLRDRLESNQHALIQAMKENRKKLETLLL